MANLLLNPGFETGSSGNPDNWWGYRADGNPTFLYPETGRSGGSSAGLSANNTSNHGVWGQRLYLDPNKTYILSGYMKTENVSSNGAYIAMAWYDSSNNWINKYTEVANITGNTPWTLYTKTLVPGTDIPSNAASGDIKLELWYSSGTVWFDDISFAESSTVRYKCSGTSCVQDDANGTYKTSNCDNACGTNGPCGQPTCYKCSGASCVQDNVNGTYTTSNCDNACGTNGPCGQPTCYKCSGTSCVQDNVNGIYTTNTCNNVCNSGNGPCGQPTCYKCSGASCIQDNVNGTYTTTNCDSKCSTNGPCGQPTCYKCSGASCIQDNVNGIYTTTNCDSKCSTNGPCGQAICYKCDGTSCVQDNTNGTYTTCSPNPCGGGGNGGGDYWLQKTTCLTKTFCIQNKYIAIGVGGFVGIIVLALIFKK